MAHRSNDSQASVSTVSAPKPDLDFSSFGPIFVLPTHLSTDELHDVEDSLMLANGALTYDANEARLFLGKVTQRRRAALELRGRGLYTVDASTIQNRETISNGKRQALEDASPAKRRRTGEPEYHTTVNAMPIVIEDDSTDSEAGDLPSPAVSPTAELHMSQSLASVSLGQDGQETSDHDGVKVVSLEWYYKCFSDSELVPIRDYVIYDAIIVPKTSESIESTLNPTAPRAIIRGSKSNGSGILSRAFAEKDEAPSKYSKPPAPTYASSSHARGRHSVAMSTHPPRLARETTSEHEYSSAEELPAMPDWVLRHSTYSCERSTPINGPNESFVEELKKIRVARELTADEIGVRAYSTAIASIAAYPHSITTQREILALPGCDSKIASLWREWKDNDGFLRAAYDAENDETLKILKTFYEIWGVGAKSAREFYNRGWRDIDDVISYGWTELTRTQQIGVKYYDEFQQKISRDEVEFIAKTVHEAAQRVREPNGVRTTIVGGYRRGKALSGDVDVIVSHLDEEATIGIVHDIVAALEDDGWITHELITTAQNSKRGQEPRSVRRAGGGHGLDHLDKSMLVWQNPSWPGRDEAMRRLRDKEKVAKENPNPHRRLDVIVSPWSTVGCAVLGWTSGTTFQRDLRRYAKYVKRWKFDSSGIRNRETNEIVDLESVGGRCTIPEEAEKRVFAGMGLTYREPWERCTG